MLRSLAVMACGAALVVGVACAQSDAGITTAVKARFAVDDTVKAHEINVDTRSGVVTLTGTVETAAAKEQAVALARETEGVADVVDQITVTRASAGSDGAVGTMGELGAAASDAALTAAIKSKMVLDPTVGALQIDVDSRDGVVTLSGALRNTGERDRAIAIARETEGVKSVDDRLVVKP